MVMTDPGLPSPPRWGGLAAIVLFPLVGPAVSVLLMAAPLALLGLFALGPGGLLYYFMLATWWLPSVYALFAPPLFCAGVAVALARLIFTRSNLLVALVASEVAFLAYFAVWYVAGIEGPHDYAHIRASFFRSPTAVMPLLVMATMGWFATRAFEGGGWKVADWRVAGEPSRRWEAPALLGALAAGAVGLWAMLAAFPLIPEEAWKDCTASAGYDDTMRGCTGIIERGSQESADRLAEAYLRRGQAFHDRGATERAIADYSEAIRLDPARAATYAHRGRAYLLRGNHDGALADLDEALRRDPEVLKDAAYHVYRTRGLERTRRGDFDGAIADHSEEIKRKPFYADGYLNRAAAYLAVGDRERAIADYSEAIRVEAWRADGYVGRGTVYLAQGDADRALADFDEAIRRRPELRLTAPAYRKRGEVLEGKGRLAEAAEAFEKAISLNPSDREAAAGRDRVRAALSRPQ